jgi:5-methylcytosine-specific restriction endonuclease McrA
VKERNRARNLEYHHKHKDEINRKDRERVKKLRESSPEILKAERQVQWERDVKRVGRDEINRKMREWRKNNPEKCKEYGRRQRSKGNDRAYYYQYKWRKLNRDKFLGSLRVRSARRKALKNNNGGEFTQQEWTDLCNKYGNICLCCGKKKKLTADHIIPLSLGGTSNIDNIQPLCQSCNSKKRVRIIDYRPDFKGVQ